MTYLAIASTILKLLLWLMKKISYAEISAAEARGEELGQLRAYKEFQEVLDGKIARANTARDDVASGRVPVDPETDPNNRANRKPVEPGL